CPPFEAYGKTFTHEKSEVRACDDYGCATIRIADGTWVYAYAASGGATIALTNWGDALLFRDGKWCRMRLHYNDAYRCSSESEPPIKAPRKVQFYSSTLF